MEQDVRNCELTNMVTTTICKEKCVKHDHLKFPFQTSQSGKALRYYHQRAPFFAQSDAHSTVLMTCKLCKHGNKQMESLISTANCPKWKFPCLYSTSL